MSESRVKKSLLNARVNLIFYVLTIFLSFFSRKIFLDCLGADFVGLTGTLMNLLGFLNLAELGIGAAIGYVLYKPLFDKDQERICEIISVFAYLYRWIGYIILGLGCLLACFLPVIFPDTGISLGVIFAAYFSFLASSLLGYFVNYKQTLLGADQRNYVVVTCYQGLGLVKTVLQVLLAWYTRNYYLWVGIELLFGVIHALVLNMQISRAYPWLVLNVSNGRRLLQNYPEIAKYIKQVFVHKIGWVVQWQSAPVLVYSFANLSTVAMYGNYSIVLDKVAMLLNSVFESTNAGVGNLIAEGNKEKTRSVFWEILLFRLWVCGVEAFCVYFLINPFIILWVGEKYLLGYTCVIVILFNSCVSLIRGCVGQFIFGAGLFHDIWAAIAEAMLNIVSAVVLGSFYGLPGVLAGASVSHICISLGWKPYFLFSKYFNTSVLDFYFVCGAAVVVISIIWMLIATVADESVLQYASASFTRWTIVAAALCLCFSISSYAAFYAVFPGMRRFTNRMITAVFRK